MGNALNLEKNYNCFSHKFENRGKFVCVLKLFFINKLSGRQTLQNPIQTQIQHP